MFYAILSVCVLTIVLALQDSVLEIKGVQTSDEASYQCQATNQLGSSYSAAQLRVFSELT